MEAQGYDDTNVQLRPEIADLRNKFENINHEQVNEDHKNVEDINSEFYTANVSIKELNKSRDVIDFRIKTTEQIIAKKTIEFNETKDHSTFPNSITRDINGKPVLISTLSRVLI